jgi:hypothetical protein
MKRLVTYAVISFTLACIFCFMGTMQKIAHNPNASYMLLAGVVLQFIAILLFILYAYRKSVEKKG